MFNTIIQRIIKMLFYLSAVPLFTIVILTVIDIFARYVFRTSLFDTIEMTSLLLSVIISLGLAYVTYQREHVSVSLFVNMVSDRVKKILDSVTSFIAFTGFSLLTWKAMARALYSLKLGEFVGSREIPVYPAKFIFAFGCLLTTFVLMLIFIDSLLAGKKKRPLNAK